MLCATSAVYSCSQIPARYVDTHCQLSCHTKISQFGMTFVVEEDVAGLDVSMDLPSRVEVLKTLQCVV